MTSEATVAVVELERERAAPWTIRSRMAAARTGARTYPMGATASKINPTTRTARRAPLSSHHPTNGRTMTATRQKKAAHMPARASVPPRLFMKNGNVERLMMWFVNTQRFTRMMSTRSRVHSLHCGRAGLAELCMRIPFVETAFGRPRRSSGPVNRTYATGPLID